MGVVELARYIRRPPVNGDGVLICCQRAPRRPVTLVTEHPDDLGHWYELVPPAEIAGPRDTFDARWMAHCGGCSRAHGSDPRRVPVRGHFFYGEDDPPDETRLAVIE